MFLSHGTFTQNGKQTREIFSKVFQEKANMFLIQGVASDCITAKLKPMKVFCLFSSDEDACVKVVILAKIK